MRGLRGAEAAGLRAAVFTTAALILAVAWCAAAIQIELPTDLETGWIVAVSMLPAIVVTSLLLARVPGQVVGRVMVVYVLANLLRISAGASGILLLETRPEMGDALRRLGDTAWAGTLPMLAVLVAVFPDGPRSMGWRWAVRMQVAAIVYGTIVTAVEWPDTESLLNVTARPPLVGVLVVGLVAAIRLFLRHRAATKEERRQLDVFVWAVLATAGWYVLSAPLFAIGFRPAGMDTIVFGMITGGIPTALAFAVVRRHLYGIDVVVNRALVWASVTLVLVAVYLAAGTLVGLVASGVLGGLAPALVVAGAFAPVRGLLQRWVDRVMYGDRQEPTRALRNLGSRLAGSVAADEVPRLIVDAVAVAVRSPFVRLEIESASPGEAEERGQPTPGVNAEMVELRHSGEVIGRLFVEPRPGEAALPARERQLLSDLAAHSAAGVVAARATAELVRSRDRLVRGREAERDRLRRDLHDGLSPSLAGIALMVDMCRARLRADPDAVEEMLERVAAETQASSDAIRRLLADLRPAALDEMGLAAALVDRADQLSAASALAISVEMQRGLPPLPPAVELATYRIAVEGMTNAVRHAGAHSCTVEITSVDGECKVVVTDDGGGLPPVVRENGGLASIRERALDLGGEAVFDRAPSGGTRVVARLPLDGT